MNNKLGRVAAAYGKRSPAWGCWTLVLALMGIASTIGASFLAKPYEDQLQGWIVIPICVPFLAFIIAAIALQRWMERRRVREIEGVLRDLELDFVREMTPSMKEHVRLHVEDMDKRIGLPTGVEGVQWFAYTPEVLILEHMYIVGSGKHAVEYFMTIIAWTAESSSLPFASLGKTGEAALISSRGRAETRNYLKGWGEEKLIDDPELDAKWLLYGYDGSLQKLAFGGSREFLLQSPRGERWWFDAYWAACAFPFPMDAKDIGDMYAHVRRVLGG